MQDIRLEPMQSSLIIEACALINQKLIYNTWAPFKIIYTFGNIAQGGPAKTKFFFRLNSEYPFHVSRAAISLFRAGTKPCHAH